LAVAHPGSEVRVGTGFGGTRVGSAANPQKPDIYKQFCSELRVYVVQSDTVQCTLQVCCQVRPPSPLPCQKNSLDLRNPMIQHGRGRCCAHPWL